MQESRAPLRAAGKGVEAPTEGLGDGSCGPTLPIRRSAQYPGPCMDDWGWNLVKYTYDTAGRLTSRHPSNGGPSEDWTFDDHGRTIVYSRSTSDHFEYDTWQYAGDLLLYYHSDNEVYSYGLTNTFDAQGRLVRRQTEHSYGEEHDEVFTLNSNGQPVHEDETTTVSYSPPHVTKRTHDWHDDARGLLLLHTIHDGTGASAGIETWTYDLAGRALTHASVDGNSMPLTFESWSYDAAGHPLTHEVTDASGSATLSESWDYDSAGAIRLHDVSRVGSYGPQLEREEYVQGREVRNYRSWPNGSVDHRTSYCANGRVQGEQELGDAPFVRRYSYNQFGDVGVIDEQAAGQPTISKVFDYDPRGNLLIERSNASSRGKALAVVHSSSYGCFVH